MSDPNAEPTPEPQPEPTPAPEPEPSTPDEETAAPESPTPDKDMVKELADPERGKYESEMVGDSTLVIRYADGSIDSFTVESVQR